MRVGIPTEIKVQEFRVGITPAGVHALKEAGHTVLVQKGAGLGSMITDEEYVAAGAQMVATAKECWDCDMVVKVKGLHGSFLKRAGQLERGDRLGKGVGPHEQTRLDGQAVFPGERRRN